MFPPSSARIYEEADEQSLPRLPGCADPAHDAWDSRSRREQWFTFRNTNASYTVCLTSPLVLQLANLVSTARVSSAPLSPPAFIWVTTAECILQSSQVRTSPAAARSAEALDIGEEKERRNGIGLVEIDRRRTG